MAKTGFKIDKVGGEAPLAPATEKPELPKLGGRKKSMKTFPRGVLKRGGTIKAVRDPAKAPPMKSRKGTLRILTEKGVAKKRQQIKHTVRNMSDFKVRETLRKAGMPVNDATPAPLARDILEGGVEAGMIVVK